MRSTLHAGRPKLEISYYFRKPTEYEFFMKRGGIVREVLERAGNCSCDLRTSSTRRRTSSRPRAALILSGAPAATSLSCPDERRCLWLKLGVLRAAYANAISGSARRESSGNSSPIEQAFK